ncbi:MAG: chorismate mutase [Deinococcus-Thermus bacterium]|jgi:chorismate mutase|nr:chorismate mutase [Deinococcota bacterium]
MERWLRGIRGATTVERDEAGLVLEATRELLQAMLRANEIEDVEPIAAIFFTSTPDLVSAFPAEAAREIGMDAVPLICNQEIPVPGRLPRVVRVMMQVNTTRRQREMRHVYLREAATLRPDLVSAQ